MIRWTILNQRLHKFHTWAKYATNHIIVWSAIFPSYLIYLHNIVSVKWYRRDCHDDAPEDIDERNIQDCSEINRNIFVSIKASFLELSAYDIKICCSMSDDLHKKFYHLKIPSN